jgi:uncharacterized protein YecE (DUF72 family)
VVFYCGTCGFSYKDWVGVYYPEGLPSKSWLSYYAREFNSLELNSTYYALPGLAAMESLAAKTGDGFLFAVKANQEMTHVRRNGEEASRTFVRILQPLVTAGKLGCVLAQFPYSFGCNSANREYLQRLSDWLPGYPLVIEFRNSTWLGDETRRLLAERGIGFCCVDEPDLPRLMPPMAEVTGKIGYIRFHGRNADKWWHHDQAWERYDYSYSAAELEQWIPRIQVIGSKAENTFIFANNHWRAQAVDTIRQVRSMLDQLVI